MQAGDEAVALAREIGHAYSEVFALVFNAGLHQHRRDTPRTRQQAEAAIALATEQELPLWLPWATVMRGWAIAEQGHWFTEGFDTADLKDAAALLEQLERGTSPPP